MSHIPFPDRRCDLVMKGGITSGVVYPPALEILSQEYMFSSIGGTSAGAVAAASAAAAEYGRAKGGFSNFVRISSELNAKILPLFDAPKETKPIREMLKAVGFFGGKDSKNTPAWLKLAKGFGSLAVHDTPYFVVGALVGAVFGLFTGAGLFSGFHGLARGEFVLWKLLVVALSILFFAALLGAIGGIVHLIAVVAFHRVPNNFYGILNGHDPDADPNNPEPKLLTDWLSYKLDILAGIEGEQRPLTFGRLLNRTITRNGKEEKAGITLQIISTNVSQGLPYRLPFEPPIGPENFLFSEQEMRRLFPSNVVDHMVKKAHKSSKFHKELLPPGFYFVPPPDEFPVVVAARMSLAIPLFFSAIPLYTIKPPSINKVLNGQMEPGSQLTTGDLQINWFSDGGTTSNFPIQSFDRWLPTRPTFGINLTAMPQGAIEKIPSGAGAEWETDERVKPDYVSAPSPTENQGDPMTSGAPLYVPAVELRAADRIETPEWGPIGNPLQFLQKVVDTARENHDNLLSALPGFRDRIVEIRFSGEEGGMNLAMDPIAIEKIVGKGKAAGKLLRDEFDPTSSEYHRWDHHRWVRFRVLMSRLEIQMQKLDEAYEKGKYADLLLHGVNKDFPYAKDEAWRISADARARQLIAVLNEWKAAQEVETPAVVGVAAHTAVVEHKRTERNSTDPHYALEFFGGNDAPETKARIAGNIGVLNMRLATFPTFQREWHIYPTRRVFETQRRGESLLFSASLRLCVSAFQISIRLLQF